MWRHPPMLVVGILSLLLMPWMAAGAQSGEKFVQRSERGPSIDTIEVVARTPRGGETLASATPGNVQQATAEELRRQYSLDLSDFMRRKLAGVFVNDAQSNPLQPDVQYRGFVASPLLGLPQGVAVYQDGVRINEPFGDTVNWALVPDSAIERISLMAGSNPLFGLNALGGALAIETKSGFMSAGSRFELLTGSFSRTKVQAETGGTSDERFGWFLSGSWLEEDGWRDFSPTEVLRLFGKGTWQTAATTLEAAATVVDTRLVGNGAVPQQLLAAERRAIFTRPDRTTNALKMLAVSLDHRATDDLLLMAGTYLRSSDVGSFNGDDSDFEPCEAAPERMCAGEDDGQEEPLLDQILAPIASGIAVEGATVNRTNTDQLSVGVDVQAAWNTGVDAAGASAIVGTSWDASKVYFDASTELGRLDATRLAVPSGRFVASSFTELHADISNASLYAAVVLPLSQSLNLSTSGRYNRTRIVLRDQLGSALDGDHEFRRFNPALGLIQSLSEAVTIFAGYSESTRAPSPVELSCADKDDPCRLPNAFVADPPLELVVARTWEAGLRVVRDRLDWRLGLFRTISDDDILFVSAGALTNEGYFENVGRTRRAGMELMLQGQMLNNASWFLNYVWLEATFRERFAVASGNNPAAIDGEVLVSPGDRLPGVPRHLLKAGARVPLGQRFVIGADLLVRSGIRLRGDEGNDAAEVDGYVVAGVLAEYLVAEALRLFVRVDNLFDARFETFGLYGEASQVLGPAFDNPRFLSPGAPRGAWLGIVAEF